MLYDRSMLTACIRAVTATRRKHLFRRLLAVCASSSMIGGRIEYGSPLFTAANKIHAARYRVGDCRMCDISIQNRSACSGSRQRSSQTVPASGAYASARPSPLRPIAQIGIRLRKEWQQNALQQPAPYVRRGRVIAAHAARAAGAQGQDAANGTSSDPTQPGHRHGTSDQQQPVSHRSSYSSCSLTSSCSMIAVLVMYMTRCHAAGLMRESATCKQ